MKVRDYIKELELDELDLEAVGIVVVIATKGTPTVIGSSGPVLAKRLLEFALRGDWPTEPQNS